MPLKFIKCIHCGNEMQVSVTRKQRDEDAPKFITTDEWINERGVCPNCGFIHNTAGEIKVQQELF